MPLTALPLTPDRMADLDLLFQARGCALARGCWCMYYRVGGAAMHPSRERAPAHRRALAALAGGDLSPGLLGYRDGQPAGWVSLGPRQHFARLARSPTMRAVDDQPVWSIVCFVVPSAWRHQGVAHELLAAAISFAGERGARLLEAYPVDREVAGAPSAPWFGSASMFAAAGFVEVARRQPARPVMRLVLAPAQR